MTTIEKIKAEIERQKEINKRLLDGQLREGCLYAFNQVLSFLSTLEEPVSDGLEEEIKSWIPPIKVKEDANAKEIMKRIREWGELIARHFAKWQKEQMLKEAVEGEVVKTDKHTSVRYKSYYGTDRYFYGIADKQFRPGDKVRIIIVKE